MSLGAALADLVLPAACAGCGAERVPLRYGACAACVAELEAHRPRPASPTPPPPGMPPCLAVGPYGGALRGVLLAYKEKGRHRLARPLGVLLAGVIAGVARDPGRPVAVVPVPSTGRAARERHGDHMARLAAHAVRHLCDGGWQAEVVRPLRVTPRPDSASLDAAGRLAVAESSLRIRAPRIGVPQRGPTMRRTLVVVDDIVTTGATLAAVATRLGEANMQVTGAAVLAATQLRRSRPGGPAGPPPPGPTGVERRRRVPLNEG